jgi:hypothetical protein
MKRISPVALCVQKIQNEEDCEHMIMKERKPHTLNTAGAYSGNMAKLTNMTENIFCPDT